MGRKCNIPQCKSGYESNPEKVSVFSTPKDDYRLAQWNKVIARKDRELTKKDCVCEKHFKPNDIIRQWTNATTIIPLQVPRLKPNAIPSIFSIRTEYKFRKTRQNSKHINKKARLTSIDLPELISESALEIVYIKEETDSPDLILDSSIVGSLEMGISEETEHALNDCNSNEDPLEILISREENGEKVIKVINENNRHFQPTASSDYLNSPVVSSNAIDEPTAPLAISNSNRGETVEASGNIKSADEQINTNSELKLSIDSVSFTSQKSLEISNSKGKQNEQQSEIGISNDISNSKDKQNEQSLEIVTSTEERSQPQKILLLSEKADNTSNIFDIIWNGALKPPNEFWSFVRIENKEKSVSFGKFIFSEKGLPVAERQVLVKKDLTTTYILNNNIVQLDVLPDVVRSVDELEEVLMCMNSFKLCLGGPSIEKYPPDLFRKYTKKKYVDSFSNVWRHSECKLTVSKDFRSKSCIFCRIVQKNLRLIEKRMQLKKNSGKDSKISDRNKSKCISRLRTRVEKLKSRIKEFQQKLSDIDKISIAEKLDAMNVPKTQQLLIMQCIDQSKLNNPRQMRFHKNWLQISLLIYQKSRGMYRFLQETGVLPLPCRRTMHRYLNGTEVKCRED